MNWANTISADLKRRFDTDGDLLLQRNILLAAFIYCITLFLQVMHVSGYFSGQQPLMQLYSSLVSIPVLLLGVYLLMVQKKHQHAILLLAMYLIIRQNTTLHTSLESGLETPPVIGIAIFHTVAFSLVMLLGIKKSVAAVMLYSGALIGQIYLSLDNNLDDSWDSERLKQFVYVHLLVLFAAYFNEWSTAKAFKGRQEAQEQARKDAQQHAKQLKQLLDNKKQLLVDVSHELRTPLTALKVCVEAMEDGINQEKETYPLLHRNINQINRLIQDIYLISKSDVQQLTLYTEDIEITTLLDELCAIFQPLAKENTLTLLPNYKDVDCYPIEGDRQRLTQLFSNILQNSIDYTDPGGSIEIIIDTNADQVNIRIQDTAPGVPTEEHSQLFERLYRRESSRSRATGGSGLGLTICKLIAEAHHGSIHITHSALGGLAVTICLPLTQDDIDHNHSQYNG